MEHAAVLIEELRRSASTLCVAESCTGGMIGAVLTAIPGSSDVFWGGAVTYHDAAKTELLGVDTGLLAACGAVSQEVASAMATGIRARAGATWSAAVTGIAGPSGGTEQKPVGTVWIAVDGPSPDVRRFQFTGGRDEVRRATVDRALKMLTESVRALRAEQP